MTTALQLGSAARDAAFADAVATLSAGSKTFRLASRLLPPEALGWGAIVYRFCRRVDDAVDEAPSPEEANRALAALRSELDAGLGADAPMQLFAQFCTADPVLRGAALALMDGVGSDLTPARFETDEELLRYAYGVAGTVGLMMCGVIGVRDPDAHPHAIDLGVAMQLTNICRDVADDAALGRRYLPAARLRAAGIQVALGDLAIDPRDSDAIAGVLRELLDLAERYYASAEAGMRYIPWKTRVAMIVAARLYRQIGHKLRRNGAQFERGRTVVGAAEKALTLLRALIACCGPPIAGYGPRRAHEKQLHRALAGLPGTAA
jgi:phytoene synthase